MAQANTQEIDLKQPKARKIEGTILTPLETDVEPAFQVDPEWAAMMAFNEELITIRVDESQDENAEKYVEVWNNGDYQKFIRGEETTCKRKFVEVLMRAKPVRYSQKAVLDDVGKVGAYREIPHRALRYHFSVVKDDNPKGGAWLKAILNQ